MNVLKDTIKRLDNMNTDRDDIYPTLFPVEEMLTISNIAYYYTKWATITEACKDIVSQASDEDNREHIYHKVQELYDLMDTNPWRAYELARRQGCFNVEYVGFDEEEWDIYQITKANPF